MFTVPDTQFPGKKSSPPASSITEMESTIEEPPRGDRNQAIKTEAEPENTFKFVSDPEGARDVKIDVSESLNPTGRLSAELLRTHPNSAKSFTGSGVFDEPSSSLKPRSFLPAKSPKKNEPLRSIGSYTSQARLITSKAFNLQLQMKDFQAIFKEKIRLSENRFPGESLDWQAWFAESMVWCFYCKQENHSYILNNSTLTAFVT
jgi:hypothetical protein